MPITPRAGEERRRRYFCCLIYMLPPRVRSYTQRALAWRRLYRHHAPTSFGTKLAYWRARERRGRGPTFADEDVYSNSILQPVKYALVYREVSS